MVYVLASFSASADTVTDRVQLTGLNAPETTSEQVKQRLGAPVHEDRNADGRYVFMYDLDLPEQAIDGKTYPPMKGVVAFLFSAEGKVINMPIFEKNKN
jgi:hypothetical protein